MDWYLQPVPSGVTIAQVIPHVLRPQDLQFVLGDMHVDNGSPHIPGSFEITGFDEWFLRVTPGVSYTNRRGYPWDDWNTSAIDASDFTSTSLITVSNLVSHGVGFGRSGLTIGTIGLTATATIGTLQGTTELLSGWSARVELPAVGDRVSLWLGYYDIYAWGWVYYRDADGVKANYVVHNDDGIATLSTMSLDLGAVTGVFTVGAGVNTIIYQGVAPRTASNWALASDKWYGFQAGPVANSTANIPGLEVRGTARILAAANLSMGEATHVYTLPEYQTGTWNSQSERSRTITTEVDVISPTVLKSPWAMTSSISVLSINGATVSTVSYIESIDKDFIYLSVPLGLDAAVEITGETNDFEFVYQGFQDGATFKGCDLNWAHPQSPLYGSDPVYIYAQPTFVKHDGDWRTLPSRVPAVIHRSTPSNSPALQLLAYVGVPLHTPPEVVDLRQPVPPGEILGMWNPEQSFEGPAYPEAGVVVITVPEGYENDARDIAQKVVPAGIVPLIEGR